MSPDRIEKSRADLQELLRLKNIPAVVEISEREYEYDGFAKRNPIKTKLVVRMLPPAGSGHPKRDWRVWVPAFFDGYEVVCEL